MNFAELQNSFNGIKQTLKMQINQLYKNDAVCLKNVPDTSNEHILLVNTVNACHQRCVAKHFFALIIFVCYAI